MKKNCNANIGDLSVKEKWGCKTTYTIVAGQYEVIDKDCIAVPFTVNDPSVNCQSLDESDYEVIDHKFLGVLGEGGWRIQLRKGRDRTSMSSAPATNGGEACVQDRTSSDF